MRFYAHGNKVAQMLLENHGNVDMDRDSFMRIIEWLDLNAQATGDLFPNKIDPDRMQELRGYVRELFGDSLAEQPDHALVNPAMPEESRLLMMSLSAEAGGWNSSEGFAS